MLEKKREVNDRAAKTNQLDSESRETKSLSNYTAILLCAGRGTRLASIRGDVPKPLFRIRGKELVRYSIDLMDHSLVDELVFIVDYKAAEIKSWASSANLPYKIRFSETSNLAIPEEVRLALKSIKRDRSIVCSTDEIRLNFQLKEAIRFHESHGLLATMVVTFANNLSKHRVVEMDENQSITRIRDAPEYISNPKAVGLVNTGLLIMKNKAADYFDLAERIGSYGITKPLIRMHQLKAYVKEDLLYYNINTGEDILDAESGF